MLRKKVVRKKVVRKNLLASKKMNFTVLAIILALVLLVALYFLKAPPTPPPAYLPPAPASAPASAPAPAKGGEKKLIFLGCFSDQVGDRALKERIHPEGREYTSLAECANEAQKGGFRYIGLQYPQGAGLIKQPWGEQAEKAECWAGQDGYSRHGFSGSCRLRDHAGYLLGDSLANAVYELSSS